MTRRARVRPRPDRRSDRPGAIHPATDRAREIDRHRDLIRRNNRHRGHGRARQASRISTSAGADDIPPPSRYMSIFDKA